MAGADDAEESASGSVALTSGDLELVTDGTSVQTVGLRFPLPAVPRGATVTQARIQFSTDEVKTAATSLQVAAQDADNAAAFTTASLNVSSRPRTPAVAWSPAGLEHGRRARGGPAHPRPVVGPAAGGVADGWASATRPPSSSPAPVCAPPSPSRAARRPRRCWGSPTRRTTPPTANAALTVEAGADQSVTLPATASLAVPLRDGLPAGSPLTTTWSQVSGASAPSPSATPRKRRHGRLLHRGVVRPAPDRLRDLSATDTLTVTETDAPPPGGIISTVVVRLGTGSDDAEEAPSGSVALTSGTSSS